MHYLTYTPAAPLNEFVDYLWLVTNGRSDRKERILPSATIELVVNLHENQIRIYDPLTLEARARFSGAVVSGTYTAPFACDGEEHTAMFGVHFKPGGALPFLMIPASELTDSHADLADLWGSAAQEFRERLCQATSPQKRFAVAEYFLRERLSLGVIPHSAVIAGLGLLRKGTSIGEVATELGFSHRHFIKLFVDQVGLPPKRVCRLLRFQRALNTVRRTDISWKDLAQKCGYFDQAHLIRDFREFAYACPSDLSDEPDTLRNHLALTG